MALSAFRFSHRIGLCASQVDVTRVEAPSRRSVGLPSRMPARYPGFRRLAPETILLDAMRQDKKVERGTLTFILVEGDRRGPSSPRRIEAGRRPLVSSRTSCVSRRPFETKAWCHVEAEPMHDMKPAALPVDIWVAGRDHHLLHRHVRVLRRGRDGAHRRLAGADACARAQRRQARRPWSTVSSGAASGSSARRCSATRSSTFGSSAFMTSVLVVLIGEQGRRMGDRQS